MPLSKHVVDYSDTRTATAFISGVDIVAGVDVEVLNKVLLYPLSPEPSFRTEVSLLVETR